MILRQALRQLLALGVSGLLVFQLAACGTLIYPERRGQTSGEIDPVIVILDGIGLLFFLVPGMVAFAIDFTTGAIYLPRGQKAKDKLERMKKNLDGRLETRDSHLVLHLDPRQLTPETVDGIVRELAGGDVKAGEVQVQVLPGMEALAGEWGRLQPPLVAAASCY